MSTIEKRCPQCGCDRMKKSKSGNRKLFFLKHFVVCIRCYGCTRKFYRRGPALGGYSFPQPAELVRHAAAG